LHGSVKPPAKSIGREFPLFKIVRIQISKEAGLRWPPFPVLSASARWKHGRPWQRTARSSQNQHNNEHLSVEQLAAAVGVSERTLRDAFQQYFGVAPVQFLNSRTLHQVRAALKAADPPRATVTKIATQFGVWQFGRFARDYRFLFRELLSETLRLQR
jgi:transcriptional regulator GlxA family with amidase domain